MFLTSCTVAMGHRKRNELSPGNVSRKSCQKSKVFVDYLPRKGKLIHHLVAVPRNIHLFSNEHVPAIMSEQSVSDLGGV